MTGLFGHASAAAYCFTLDTNYAQCGGYNAEGELGVGDGYESDFDGMTTISSYLVVSLTPPAGLEYLMIAIGQKQTAFLLNNGDVYTSGSNTNWRVSMHFCFVYHF